jgi:diguanylate cyclase (GGDEF)-like protein
MFGGSGEEEGQVAVFTDIREIKEAEEKLRRYAYQDVLTGLPNYRAFAEALGRRVTSENAADHPFILIFIDLDRLKQINDFYGHEKGDQVIQDLAGHISDVLPPGHLLCRRSGDEFLAIVDYENDEELETLRRRLDRRLDSYMITIEMETLTTSISAGVTIFPTFSRHYATLLQQADAALYEAKRDRANRRVVWFTSALGEKIERRLKIESVLEKAIISGKIIAHYQPEVEMPSGKVVGFEALARWHDPILGDVGPAEFIEIAEENGLIGQLTRSIVTQVFDAIPSIRAHVPGASISFNVSPQLFINRNITNMLSQYGFTCTSVASDISPI